MRPTMGPTTTPAIHALELFFWFVLPLGAALPDEAAASALDNDARDDASVIEAGTLR